MSVTIVGNNTPTAGSVVYGDGSNYASTAAGTSGQLLTSAGASTPTWTTLATGFTLGTPITTTSGSIAEFTGIPSTAKVVYINLQNVVINDSAQLILQLGTASTYLATGYLGGASYISSDATVGTNNSTTNFLVGYLSTPSASAKRSGAYTLTLLNSSTNLWCLQGSVYDNNFGDMSTSAGYVTLTNALTKLKITTVSGGSTFTAGSINISYI